MSERDGFTLKVLFFGAARDAAAASEATVEIEGEANVADVKRIVFAQYPELSGLAKSLIVAVNEDYATDETSVLNADVIAFLPPVSGG